MSFGVYELKIILFREGFFKIFKHEVRTFEICFPVYKAKPFLYNIRELS